MTTFVLIPGAGGMASYWSRIAPLLERAGHEVLAVDLPGDDPTAGLRVYADKVIGAVGARTGVIVVAQSLGGFTAPLVCERADVAALILVNAMIPKPGETAGEWWDNTGAVDARTAAARASGYSADFDVATYFLHDVPEAVLREAPPPREEAPVVFGEPCRFSGWRVPVSVVAGQDDRFFPLAFQQKVAKERLGAPVDQIRGGHLVALSNPQGLAERVLEVASASIARGTRR